MISLAEPSIHDFDMSEEFFKNIGFEHVELLLDLWLVLPPREIRVVPPPWIVCLRLWPT